MVANPHHSFRFLAALLVVGVSVAASEPQSASGARASTTVPPGLSQWELTVSQRGAFSTIRPIKVRSDGRYECEELVQDNKGSKTISHAGVLSQRDCAAVFTAAMIAFNRVTFAESSVTWDVGPIVLRLCSGSRALEVALDEFDFEALELDASFRRGIQVLNSIIRRHRKSPREFTDRTESTRSRSVRVSPTRRAVVPESSPAWQSIQVRIVSKTQDVLLRVRNPDDPQIRRYNWTTDMDVSIVAEGQGDHRTPRRLASTDDERRTFLDCAQVILNQFELHEPREEEAKGEVRCIVQISAGTSMHVEFQINDALPADWRSHLARIVEIGRRKDDSFPVIPGLSGSNE